MTQRREMGDRTEEPRAKRQEAKTRRQEPIGQEARIDSRTREPIGPWFLAIGRPSGSWLMPIACLCLLLGAGSPTGLAFQKPAAAAVSTPASEPTEEQLDQSRGALDRFLDSHPEIQRDV